MFKIVVVDDELWFRLGIKGTIQWSKYDIEIVGEAGDGEEALEVIEREQPDIVFADVRMPVMDGLELASIISKRYPDIKVVIVSGYEEFEYARKALSVGVTHYLTKPVEANLLVEVVYKVIEQIRQERQDKEKRIRIEEQLKESLPLLKEKFLNSLVNEKIKDMSVVNDKLEFLQLNLPLHQFMVFVIDVEYKEGMISTNYEKNRQMIKLMVLNSINETLQEEDALVFNGYSEFLIGIASYNATMDTMFINMRISKLLARLKIQLQKKLNISVTIGVSRVNTGLEKVHIAYKEAAEAIKHKLFAGSDQIFFYQDININNLDQTQYVFSGKEELIDAIRLCDGNTIKQIFEKNHDALIKLTNLDIDYVQQLYFPVLGDVINILYDIGEVPANVFKGNPFKKLMQLTTLYEINNLLINISLGTVEAIIGIRNKKSINTIQNVMDYIYNNYNKDISLNSAAQHVGLSPAYLSRLFRKETEKSFIEYLMRVRVEKAKILLKKTDKKTYEIAKEVGYNDIRYFTKMFKTLEGITPVQYRECV